MDSPLNGTNGDDRIYGYAGDDVISAMMGADLVYGDTGADTIHGGQGDDCIHGGKDGDALFGDIGNDTLFGDRGDDQLQGGEGDDTYVFDAANTNPDRCNVNGTITCDATTANDGNDTISGETATSGTDTVFITNAAARDVCLDRENDDLVVRVCVGSPPGSIRLPSYFSGQSLSGMNKLERIWLTGN